MIRAIQEYFGMSVFFAGDVFDDRKYTQSYTVVYWKPHSYYQGMPATVKKEEMTAFALGKSEEAKVSKAFKIRFKGLVLHHVKEN
jgi:hypothetical protein